MLPWSFQVMLVLLVALAAGFDIRYRRIPNWLVVIGMVWGLGMNAFLFEWPGLKMALIGIGLAFLVYFPLFLLRGMGAGDVKLMMAIGALIGPANWFLLFLVTGILGGVVAVAVLIWRRSARRTFYNVFFILGEMLRLRAPYAGNSELDVKNPNAITMPHGATIAAATVMFLIGRSVL